MQCIQQELNPSWSLVTVWFRQHACWLHVASMKKAGIASKNKEDIVNKEKAYDLIVPVCELHAGCSKLESLGQCSQD